jgi:signal transduction histidine kinase
VITGLSVLLYRYYRKAFERIVLGIKHPPEGLIRNYAQRITNSLDHNALANLLKEEILPSLLIRESVLYYFDDHSEVKSLFKIGVSERDLQNFTNTAQVRTLAEESLRQDIQKQMPWVRLALPLRFESETVGVWCFGRKDPNEIYTPEFTEDLRSMANQTTLALLNIRQRILLQALYNANVDRQEEEKTGIARDLHDVLLPSLGYLVELQSNKCDLVEFEHAVQRINNMIREIMSGLRPSTLDMGLNIALEELADEPEAQIGGKFDIHTHLTVPEPVNYDNKAELHLYRMVQQASRNALEHAQANSIQIYGTLLRDSLNIHIEDDGIGFPFEGMPDLSTLIANRHFGLANIFERAEIINATVKIDSRPNEGTCVHIFWSPNMKG